MKKIFKGCLMVLFLAGFLAGCGGGGDDLLPSSSDDTAPTVLSTVPADTAPDVATNTKKIIATFDEAMNPDKITDTGVFTLTGPGGAGVGGAVTYSVLNHIAIFTPSAPLTAGLHTATITTAAKDVSGNPLAAAKIWSFTVGSSADTTPPVVNSISPADNASNVKTDTDINVTFTKVMDPETITTNTAMPANFIVQDETLGSSQIPGEVTYNSATTTATFNPTVNLFSQHIYKVRVTIDVADLAGNKMQVEFNSSFTTD